MKILKITLALLNNIFFFRIVSTRYNISLRDTVLQFLFLYFRVFFLLDLQQYYSIENNFCFCNDIRRAFDVLGIDYEPSHWRLLIDGSLYTIWVHSYRKHLTYIPLAHSFTLKGTHEDLSFILGHIKYKEHEWLVGAPDLKDVAI